VGPLEPHEDECQPPTTQLKADKPLGVDLNTIQQAATHIEPYVRIDGTVVWSLMQLERQLRPDAYGRVRGGYVARRRPRATGVGSR
jgi:hypothetical protein